MFDAARLAGKDPLAWRQVWRERRSSRAELDQSGVWRFRELLPPFERESSIVSLREGNTPLYRLQRCAEALGVEQLWAKHLGMNPTGSFKDSGMTVAVSRAREEGRDWLACASTGNTSASMAAYAARAGLRSLVLVPAGQITWAKLAQAVEYGARTLQLQTDFDGCVRVLRDLVTHAPVYLVNSVNPYRLEGQKTVAAEILEALDWRSPDHVIVPGGNLANASALGKGWMELHACGVVDRLPHISVIQAEGANPLVRSLRDFQGRELRPLNAVTLASAIRIGNPASWKKVVQVLHSTGGWALDVTEGEIAIAKADLGRDGISCEPASAAALAGARKLRQQNRIQAQERVVVVLTGHGLKDTDYTLRWHQGTLLPGQPPSEPVVLPADATAVLHAMED
ncbi:MAG: threonine synthase [Terriglobales bacterium]